MVTVVVRKEVLQHTTVTGAVVTVKIVERDIMITDFTHNIMIII